MPCPMGVHSKRSERSKSLDCCSGFRRSWPLLFAENDFVPWMTICLGVVRQRLALPGVRDIELGCFLDLFWQTFDARFPFKVRADSGIQFAKSPKSVPNLNDDF